MKTLLTAFALVACVGCSHTSDNSAKTDAKSEPTAKGGWESVKEGTKEAGRGVGETAEAAGESIKESAQEAGHAIKSAACPVVADKSTGKYYRKGDKGYETMLKGEKVIGSDMRECFTSEQNAKEDGYKSSIVGR